MDERPISNGGAIVATAFATTGDSGGDSGGDPGADPGADSGADSGAGRSAPPGARAQMLARVRRSRVFSECLVTPPSEAVFYVRLLGRWLPVPLALAFIAVAARRDAAPPWLAPAALAGCGAFLVAALVRVVSFRSAPLVRRPALVADVRRVVARHRRHTTVRHFATLEFETGESQEFEVTAAMAAGLATGRGGVAFERDRVLLQFRRVEV